MRISTVTFVMADDIDGSCEMFLDSFGVSSEDFMSSCLKDSSEDNDERPKTNQPTKATKSSTKHSKSTSGKSKGTTGRKKTATSLNEKEMDELAAWVFSGGEAGKVEQKVRETLTEMERIKLYPVQQEFAKHLISHRQEQNFKLMIAGFCRKFSLLSQEIYSKPSQDRKALLSCAWMKIMGNFQVEKATQERIILVRCIADMSQRENMREEDVHCVVSVIHELVYKGQEGTFKY